MKTLSCAPILITLVLAACSDEADIGIQSQPITCIPSGAAFMEGFGDARPLVERDGAGMITSVEVWTPNPSGSQVGKHLNFYFECGQPELATYALRPTQRSFSCPYEVTSSLVGANDVWPAEDGMLIIDEMSSCLAGRFVVGLEAGVEGGSVSGWFSVPLP